MKLKMADVARTLGVSKATVSLAVNDKPGVSTATRKRILDYIEEKRKEEARTMAQNAEAGAGNYVPERTAGTGEFSASAMIGNNRISGNIIRVLVINHQKQIACDPELDLWSGVLSTFDEKCRKNGYMYSPSFLNDSDSAKERSRVIEECNSPAVRGIILFGTEMEESDTAILKLIKKPLVVYDYDVPGNQYSCVMINNVMAAQLAVDALTHAGARRILYLANSKEIYNFDMRRRGFSLAMRSAGIDTARSDIVPIGGNIEEITKKAVAWLSYNPLPDAFVFENYQVSVGVMNAVRHLRISVPGSLKFVGIDEVPGFLGGGIILEQVRIPHEERAAAAFCLLRDMIEEGWSSGLKVFSSPILVEGMSV